MQGIKIGDYRHKMCCTITAGENGTRQALVRVAVCRHSFHCPSCLAGQELCHVPFYPHYHYYYYHGRFAGVLRTGCPTPWRNWPVSRAQMCVCVWLLLLLLWSFHCCAQNGMSNSMAGLASQQSPDVCVCGYYYYYGHFTVVHRTGCPTPWRDWPVSRAQMCVCVVIIIIIMVISLLCTERDVQLHGGTGQSAELHPG